MNKEIFFGRNSIRFLYFRYKDSAYYNISVIVITIVICILLIFQFIMPQLEQWFSIRNEIIATRARTEIINNNALYMNSVDKNLLTSQVQTTILALPTEKNFGNILDAMSLAALRSGVSFQDYTFQVGKVSSQSAQVNSQKIPGLSSVSIAVIINGTVDEVQQFMQEMAKTLPLSEVISVDGATGAVTVTMDFYQKNLPTQTLKDDQPIPRVIENNETMINRLASWQVGTRPETVLVGSSAAIPLF